MIKTRGRKIVRDILARKGRTALVALSIMIGVFGAVTLISTNDLMVQNLKDAIRPEEVAMTRLFVSVPSADTTITPEDNQVYLDLLSDPRRNNGVEKVEGIVVAPVFWRDAEAQAADTRYRDAFILAYSSPFDEIQLEGMRLYDDDSKWPQSGEIAIERRFADKHNLGLGDVMYFRPLGGGESEPQAWRIAAIVYHPYWVEGSDTATADMRIYANYDDAQQIAGFTGYTAFYLSYDSTQRAENEAEDLMRLVRDEKIDGQAKYVPLGYWLDDPDNYFLIGEIQEVTKALDVLAYVALIVSGFLVTNVINTIVVEQKGQIGVLKSLGATRLDNFVIYAGVALLYGLVGTIPGVILGVIAGSAMVQQVAPLADLLIEGFNVSRTGVLIGAVMGMLVPIVAALIPVFNGTRVSIIEAMTDLGIASEWGTGRAARIIDRLPVPMVIRQALSNVAQKKGRLALTGVTLTLAAAAFMGVFAMFTVLMDEFESLFDTFDYEIVVSPANAQSYDTINTLIMGTDGAGAVEGVDAVQPAVSFGIDLMNVSDSLLTIDPNVGAPTLEVFALGIEPSSQIVDMDYTDGEGWGIDSTRPGIVLSEAAARDLKAEAGSTVRITAGGSEQDFEVIGVMSYPFPTAFMRWQDLAQLAGFVDSSGEPQPNVFLVQMTQEDPTVSEIDDVIDKVSARLLESEQGIAASYENQVATLEEITQSILAFGVIFQITSGVMAAVGAIGLLTTLSMAVYERQKEIGVMRSIGAGSGTIVAQFLTEGILIGVISWALAVPLSYYLAIMLMDALDFSDFISFSYPLWVLGMGLAGMIVVAIIASLWPALAASRKTVSDILRYQ